MDLSSMVTAKESVSPKQGLESTVWGEVQESPEGLFTRYVKALGAQSDAVGELFDEVCQALRAALARELRRRSLWSSPPSFVGVYGWASWSAPESGLGRATSPLEELLTDCYASIFLQRLPRLLEQLRVRPAVDGLVIFYLRNFLHVRQKDHDPVGYRIFEVLKSAVRDAVAAGELYVLRGGHSIRNTTVLASSAQADPETAASPEDLRPIVERWNDDLLPGLMTATGEPRRQLIERLRGHLFDLEAEAVRVFCFKDLLDPLKFDVRARWAALFELEEGEAVHETDDGDSRIVIRLLQPDTRAEDMDSFKKLVGCVAQRIEGLDTAKRTRRYLRQLWAFLRRFATDEKTERLPSNRKLAALLHIPRERLPGLYGNLGRMIRRCEGTLSGAVVDLDERRRRSTRTWGGRHG